MTTTPDNATQTSENISPADVQKQNLISQWAFDARPILGRFHLWLEDVRIHWHSDASQRTIKRRHMGAVSFTDRRTEKMLAVTAAVTALGTRLFGRYGEGKGMPKTQLNLVKKDADAISAYVMSESLWYLSRTLPENHAIMVCLGEGLMPKAGETAEMGANPLLGFGRIYARPQVAKFLEDQVLRLINEPEYTWENFSRQIQKRDITVWGAAIDTLENTSRFAKGEATGPMSVFHLFDQPLIISDQYEGYMGCLVLPEQVVENASLKSILVNYFTPRHMVMDAIQDTFDGIKAENVHVWTLTGDARRERIENLWDQWRDAGAHLIDDAWSLPTGMRPFTDSGTYAPTFAVKTWTDDKEEIHLLLVDGYAASAEAIQAASLSGILGLDVSLAVLSSKFKLPYDKDAAAMKLDPQDNNFATRLEQDLFETDLHPEMIEIYRNSIMDAQNAGIPLKPRTINASDLIAAKKWQTLAVSGYMLPDPYSGAPGVKQISENAWEVTVRVTSEFGDKAITFALRLLEPLQQSKLVFSPLLNRFFKGEDFRTRPVKISDSGRIRNELQTLCTEALEHFGDKIVVRFDKMSTGTISAVEQERLKQILAWYKENYPIWFEWLELSIDK
ncbi:MAG: hypothetical protein CSA25_00640 [Desulfobacter postgatei]|uniref:Uncharacterized protein n=1 Tax=Desulfobacter postgatei TaxID=2293 RepID=A0A2G6MTC2_9BACT|nr:MAG: hypothetical protein CSA25_00640 [Desulfobacter postgatei]